MSTSPAKRKRTSSSDKKSPNVTQSSISSFFATNTPTKPPDKTKWQARDTLLIGRYFPSDEPNAPSDPNASEERKTTKIAAFDLDSTLIRTKSGKVYASNAQDWKWWHPSIPDRLRKLHLEDGFRIAVISNQAGLSIISDSDPKSKLSIFKKKVSEIFSLINVPINIYAATEKDSYRKPRTGIWAELLKDFEIDETSNQLRLEESFFVGDAAGRPVSAGNPKDFSCCDRDFAENINIRFSTPEEYFLEEEARPFVRLFEPSKLVKDSITNGLEIYTKNNEHDIVLICGCPGAGKSSWFRRNLEPLGYIRINQDTLKTRDKCIKVASKSLDEGKSIAIDNTNADCEVRSKWVELAVKHSIPIRCVYLKTPTEICVHNDTVRALNDAMNPEKRTMLPNIAFNGFKKRFEPPQINEGFQDVTEVAFKFYGSTMEKNIWGQHWV